MGECHVNKYGVNYSEFGIAIRMGWEWGWKGREEERIARNHHSYIQFHAKITEM